MGEMQKIPFPGLNFLCRKSPLVHLNGDHKYAKIVSIGAIIVSIGTDRFEQTVQIQISLLLKEQSDQHLHCLYPMPSSSFRISLH